MTLDELNLLVHTKDKTEAGYERAFVNCWRHCGGINAPVPEYQYRFDPTRKWQFDFCWPEYKLACEIDGGRWVKGGGKHATPADYDKINQATLQGWRVLRFTGEMLNGDPFTCIQVVLKGLGHYSMEGAIKHE